MGIIGNVFNFWNRPAKTEKPKLLQHVWRKTNRKWPINDFVAIDVETSTPERHSICQIGVIFVENGKVVRSINEYVQPPGNVFATNRFFPHKIKPEMTIDKPFFHEIWEVIYPQISGKLVVAHNASNFDLYCILSTLNYYGLSTPEFEYECTYELTKMKLKDACACYDINMINHHDAVFDAEACAELFLKIQAGHCPDLSKKKISAKKTYSKSEYEHKKVSEFEINIDVPKDIANNPFYDKTVLLTGDLQRFDRQAATILLKEMGARVVKTVSKNTEIVIIGDKPGPSKIEKINDLKAQGCEIELIPEKEFMKILSKSNIKV